LRAQTSRTLSAALGAGCALALLTLPGSLAAQAQVYRCTSADGSIEFRQHPCADRQRSRTVKIEDTRTGWVPPKPAPEPESKSRGAAGRESAASRRRAGRSSDEHKYAERCWRKRQQIQDHLRAQKDCHTRHRRIFYDTDNIQEIQNEEIVVCDACAGALKIESSARGRQRIMAIHAPVDACPACLDKAQQWYETANPDHFDQIFLQHRDDDAYHLRK